MFRKMGPAWLALVWFLTLTLTLTLTPGPHAQTAALAGAEKWRSVPGTYAILETSMGTIVIKLMPEAAPKAVASFTGLATGTRQYTDPRTGRKTKSHYFDGQVFHRVIDGFMIQSGDPKGDGTGGPGYTFENEFAPGIVFDRPGRVGLANLGPNTNGSQFFITLAPQPHLNMKHTIFGQVVEGQKVANAIGKVKTVKERPVTPVTLKVKIEEIRDEAAADSIPGPGPAVALPAASDSSKAPGIPAGPDSIRG